VYKKEILSCPVFCDNFVGIAKIYYAFQANRAPAKTSTSLLFPVFVLFCDGMKTCFLQTIQG